MAQDVIQEWANRILDRQSLEDLDRDFQDALIWGSSSGWNGARKLPVGIWTQVPQGNYVPYDINGFSMSKLISKEELFEYGKYYDETTGKILDEPELEF